MFHRSLLIMGVLAALFAASTVSIQAKTEEAAQSAGAVNAITPEEVTTRMIGQEITLQARIIDSIPSQSPTHPFRFVLRKEDQASLEMIFWPELGRELLADNRFPKNGQYILAKGELTRYRDNLQVKVLNASDISVWDQAPTAQMVASASVVTSGSVAPRVDNVPLSVSSDYMTIQDLDAIKGMENKMISFHGTVNEFRSSWNERAPNIIYFRRGEGEAETLECVYWTNNPNASNVPNFTQPGTPVFFTGEVQYYNGRLQVKVDDLANLSQIPLPQNRLSANYVPPTDEELRAIRAAAAADTNRIAWEKYSPLGAQQKLDEQGHVLIYIRSEKVPYCSDVERAYMLHPDALKYLGARKIYYLNADEPSGQVHAKRLKVDRVPALILLQRTAPEQRLIFTPQTAPREVMRFFQSVPREK